MLTVKKNKIWSFRLTLSPTYIFLFFILHFSFLIQTPVFSQSAQIITLDHPIYTLLNRLQQRGHLDGLNPNQLPWSLGQIQQEMLSVDELELSKTELVWFDQIVVWLKQQTKNDVGFQIQTGGFHSNYLRNDVLRPGFSSNGPMPNASIRVFFAKEHFAAQSGFTLDRYYDQDPDGLDIARRLMSRSENTYVAYQNDWFSARWGRFKESWSGIGLPGVLLTENPAAFDHASLHFGNETWKFSSLVGELDMLSPEGSFRSRDRFAEGGIRRFVAMHRLDWKPFENLQLTAFEGLLYSSPSSSFSLQYANPLPVYFLESDNEPKNNENNLMLGFGAWWRWQKITVQSQVVFDDGVYENRRWRQQAGELEPASVALTGSVLWADVVSNVDVLAQVHNVSNLSYRTDQMEGQWSYAQRGLASNFSDFKHRKIKFSWQAEQFIHGLTVSPYVDRLLQGEGDFRLTLANDGNDSGNAPQFFQGTVEKTWRVGIEALWMPLWNVQVKVDAGLNQVENRFHIAGNSANVFVGQLGVVFRMER